MASISLATTIYFVVGGVSGLFVARVIAKRDVRIPIVAGGIIGGVSLAALGQVEERWQLYVVYAVFAFGFSGAGLIPVTTVVDPLVPRPAVGQAVGRLDGAVGRRRSC